MANLETLKHEGIRDKDKTKQGLTPEEQIQIVPPSFVLLLFLLVRSRRKLSDIPPQVPHDLHNFRRIWYAQWSRTVFVGPRLLATVPSLQYVNTFVQRDGQYPQRMPMSRNAKSFNSTTTITTLSSKFRDKQSTLAIILFFNRFQFLTNKKCHTKTVLSILSLKPLTRTPSLLRSRGVKFRILYKATTHQSQSLVHTTSGTKP